MSSTPTIFFSWKNYVAFWLVVGLALIFLRFACHVLHIENLRHILGEDKWFIFISNLFEVHYCHLLGIASSRRWRDTKEYRRFPKVPKGYAEASAKMTKHQPEGSSKMMKHRRVRRGSAPEDGILSRRDAWGSVAAKNDGGEVPRSSSKVVAKGRRTP